MCRQKCRLHGRGVHGAVAWSKKYKMHILGVNASCAPFLFESNSSNQCWGGGLRSSPRQKEILCHDYWWTPSKTKDCGPACMPKYHPDRPPSPPSWGGRRGRARRAAQQQRGWGRWGRSRATEIGRRHSLVITPPAIHPAIQEKK